MFQHFNSIDPRLAKRAKRLENREAGFSILAAKVLTRPAVDVRAVLTIAKPRRLHILKEFILKAATTIDPPPTQRELAHAFALDPLFIVSTCNELARAGLLKAVSTPSKRSRPSGRGGSQEENEAKATSRHKILITDPGRAAPAQGIIDEGTEHVSVTMRYDVLAEQFFLLAEDTSHDDSWCTAPDNDDTHDDNTPPVSRSNLIHRQGTENSTTIRADSNDLWYLLHTEFLPTREELQQLIATQLTPDKAQALLVSNGRWLYAAEATVVELEVLGVRVASGMMV